MEGLVGQVKSRHKNGEYNSVDRENQISLVKAAKSHKGLKSKKKISIVVTYSLFTKYIEKTIFPSYVRGGGVRVVDLLSGDVE